MCYDWSMPSNHPGLYPDDRTVFIMQGVPGSGKSTVAEMLVSAIKMRGMSVKVLSTDDYWWVRNEHETSYDFDPEQLGRAHRWNQKRCDDAMRANYSYIIIDNTNIKGSQALPYRVLADIYGYSVMVVSVDCGLEEAIARNSTRSEDRQVPEETIRQMYNNMERLMT